MNQEKKNAIKSLDDKRPSLFAKGDNRQIAKNLNGAPPVGIKRVRTTGRTRFLSAFHYARLWAYA